MYRGPISNRLLNEEIKPAVGQLMIWRADPNAVCQCPRCGAAGVTITDRSARPHAEWYVFTCEACGLDAPLAVAACPGTRS